MKQPKLTRRQFMQVSALGAGALALPAIGLASVAAAPSREAQASAEQPLAPAIPQPTFNPIASNTTFGPLTDISMGWDGTLWGIDGQGAPHVYDSINDVWAQHGDGIDAAAMSGDSTTIYVFQGPNVVPVNAATLQASAPTTSAALWPTLPDSFKLGVNGAMTSRDGNGLILFNGGRYVSTDGTVPAGKLTDLTGWPQTAPWTVTDPNNPAIKDAVIDAAFTILTEGTQYLLRSGQVLRVRIFQGALDVPNAPVSFASFVTNLGAPLPADWVSSGGVDAVTMTSESNQTNQLFFKGTSVLSYNLFSPALTTTQYIGKAFNNWPATWHPVMNHAPNGRDGNLWCATAAAQNNFVVQHNGDAWAQLPNQADHVGVGQDNAVMLASAQRLWTVKPNATNTGYDVTPVTPPSNLIQVSLGNANAVNARDTSGNVYSFDPTSGNLTQNTAVGTVSHIAATNDGSLWHAKPSDANMHRQIVGSGATPDAIPVKQNLVTSVNKVAGTGFGAAHCLAQNLSGATQAYRYDSPYVFKTAAPYNLGTINGALSYVEQGAGLLFLVKSTINVSPLTIQTQVVALDAHTGVLVASTAPLLVPMNYGQPVFDPINNLVYVGTTPTDEPTNNTTPGQLLALDPRSLAVVWTFTAAAGIDAKPMLYGTRLCFGDRTGMLYMLDTAAALANPANVQPVWAKSAALNPAPTATRRIATPVYVPTPTPGSERDLIYVAEWDCDTSIPLVIGSWMSFWVADGTFNDKVYGFYNTRNPNLPDYFEVLNTAPVLGTLNVGSDSAPNYSPAVYYHCLDAVIAIGAGPTQKTFPLPAGDYISTGFTYDDGRNAPNGLPSPPPPPQQQPPPSDGWLWFGTYTGQLYCLDTNLRPVNHTPASIAPANQSYFYTTPTLYKDTQGNVTVFFQAKSVFSNPSPSLYGFDPDNGNTAALPTGPTTISALSATVTHGVLYAAGLFPNYVAPTSQFPQVFAIRVDQLVQAERDFIIESQLMQDPQDPGGSGGSTITAPDGNIIPPSVARYQTHLTVVDDGKHPLPNEPVKIWADVDGTVITVDGTQYTIGPADSAYASFKTGVDGCVVITTDATDVNASALRVWAEFMDPYERIMVYPDHEWHGRASQSNANGTIADPAKPNLNTAYSYKPAASGGTAPKPLFTDDEKSQGTTTNVANGIGQMNTGLNPGGNSAASVAGALKTLHGSNPAAPYVAYTNLGGMHYGPNNARAKRTATIAAPFGFSLSKPQGGAHTYTPLSHSDARSAIDALTGKPWDPNNPNGTATASDAKPLTFVVRRSDNIFTDFWNWLKGVVAAIENVIVSVADDIMVGINFIVNGVEQAFKAIIQVVEDVVNAIGSFFLQLAKLIEDLIEALSVLFHFGEIIWFHKWIKGQFTTQLASLTGPTGLIKATIQPAVNSFFQTGENAINDAINNLKSQLTPNGQISNLKGAGATPHSTFNVGPKGGPPSSQAVQCSHSSQKLKDGLPSASSPSSSSSAALRPAQGANPASSSDDPVTGFVTSFMARITGDGDLAQKFDDVKNDFNSLFRANSAAQFFETLVSTLLDILAAMLDSVLAITNALIDGILDLFSDFIDALMNPTTGLLNAAIDIPFVSWLYQLLFGEQLTILNALTLVAAIPATVLFRVVEGQYPSAVLGAAAERKGFGAQSVQALTKEESIAYAFFYGIVTLGGGLANGVGDFLGNAAPQLVGYAAVAASLFAAVLSIPLATNDSPSGGDWAVYGFGFVNALYGLFLIKISGTLNKYGANALSVLGGCCLSLLYVIASVFVFVSDAQTNPSTDLGLAANIVGSLSGIVNPIKFLGPVPKLIAAGLDVVCAGATCLLAILSAILSTSPDPRARRLYFPFVAHAPRPVQAHPLALIGAKP